MRMTVTKVRPVVVKHILNNQVMSIYDPKVLWLQCSPILDPRPDKPGCKSSAGQPSTSSPGPDWDLLSQHAVPRPANPTDAANLLLG